MLVKPIQGLGDFGIGLCKCGHVEGDHDNLQISSHDGKTWSDHHHGGCCAETCDCKQFIFAQWITLEEAAKTLHS